MNPRTQILLALLALSLLWVPLVFASTGEVTIAYSGLTRTREATVERIAQIQPGMSAEELNVEGVRDRLLRSGLFADVDVSLDTESMVLTIAVEERWTLIPVPFFSVDSQSVRGGFALLESNLAGTGYAGLFAGFFGSDGYQVMSGFIASSVGVRGPGLAVFAALGQSAVETSDTANELVERFDLQRYSLAAGVTAEVPVLARRWGTATLSGYYDGGVLACGASGDTGYHGPGGSVALYLARIALPAVGINVGYNVDSGFLAGSALVGFSM